MDSFMFDQNSGLSYQHFAYSIQLHINKHYWQGLIELWLLMSESHQHRPDVSGQVPCMSPNMFPQALDTAAILASTGRLWMTKETSLRCCRASVWAWPRMPNPVMSVAACALKVCMSPAATKDDREEVETNNRLSLFPWICSAHPHSTPHRTCCVSIEKLTAEDLQCVTLKVDMNYSVPPVCNSET